MKLQKLALASALALIGTGAAQAEPLDWNYVELGYNRLDGGEDVTDALDLMGSVGIGDLWHASLDYADGSAENTGGPDFDFDGWEVRAGVNPSVGANTQAVFDVLYFDYSGDFSTGEDGYGLSFGLRHRLGDKVEISGSVSYIDGSFDNGEGGGPDEDFNETHVSIGGRYFWLENLSTGLTASLDGGEASSLGSSFGSSGGDAIRFDVRWNFGSGLFDSISGPSK